MENETKGNKLTINIPIGMEIDVENSDLKAGVIMFKKKLINYNDVWSTIITKSVSSEVELFVKNQNKLAAINKLMNIASYYNGDWKPDWKNSGEYKYNIMRTGAYGITTSSIYNEGAVYFKNKDDAQAVIDNPNFKTILDEIYKN